MACKLFSPFKSHPLIACSVLLLFTPPILPMVIFFWPLIVSTALGVLAVISFGRQDEDTTSITGCDHTEDAVRMDNVAFPAQAELISNVLMVGNQEVTWLEWLHNEDTQKFRAQECEHVMPAVWDADGCDVSFAASEASVDATAWRVEDMGNVYACGPIAEDKTCASALVLTAENETRATALTMVSLNGLNDTALVDSNEEDTKKNALSFIAGNETKRNALDMTAEVWDADGCDVSFAATEATVDVLATFGNVYVCGTIAEDETCVSALVLTVENEIKTTALSVAGWVNDIALNEGDTQKNALSFVAEDETRRNALDMTAEDETNRNDLDLIAKGDDNVDATKQNAHGLTAEDEMKAIALHMAVEVETKRIFCDGRNTAGTCYRSALDSSAKYEAAEDMRKGNGLDSVVENEIDVNAPACVDGVEGQIRIDGVGLSGESESMVSAFNSGIGNAHTTVVSSLGVTIDDKSKMNDCISGSGDEVETKLKFPFLTSKAESREDAPELSSPNIVVLERKASEGHEMRHIDDEQGQEEQDFKQIDTQVPRWDEGDDEDDKSSLRFSFFHNGCVIATSVKHEPKEWGE